MPVGRGADAVAPALRGRGGIVADFHFVDDYVRLIAALKEQYPLDEAMSRAVGGAYEQFGGIEADMLEHYGLQEGHGVLDFGCG